VIASEEEIVFAPEALTDIASIGDWIARDNPQRAETFVQEIFRCCRSIGRSPLAFALVPRFERLGVRKRNYRGYLIFYRTTSVVEILHVMSDRRDYEALLFQN